jgi:hypothetical protein
VAVSFVFLDVGLICTIGCGAGSVVEGRVLKRFIIAGESRREGYMVTKYTIRVAMYEEINDGSVWIGGLSAKNLKSGSILRISRPHYSRPVYVKGRKIEKNFQAQYNDDPKEKRDPINDLDANTIVMAQWYRDGLGITDSERNAGPIDLIVEEAGVCGSMLAACHSPDPMTLLAQRFSMLGAWLGLLTLVDLILKAIEQFDGLHHWLKIHLGILGISGTTEHAHTRAMLFVAIILAVPGYFFLCRKRPTPRGP